MLQVCLKHCPLIFCTNVYAIADGPSTPEPSFNYGGSFLLSAVHAIQQQDNAAGGPCDELQQYLKAGAEAMADIIGWWGVSLKARAHTTCLI